MTTPEITPDPPDVYDVLTAFAEARRLAPEDHALLRRWTQRYPQFADDLITLDFARAMTNLPPFETDDALEDEAVTAMSRDYIRAHPTVAPLTSLIRDAATRGLDVAQFAKTLRLDRLLLSRLEQRTLEAVSIPRTLVTQIAQTLGRSVDEIADYLRARPRLPMSAHFKSERPPSLVAEGTPRPSFAEALQLGQTLTDADQAYWQAEIEAGVLGDEP